MLVHQALNLGLDASRGSEPLTITSSSSTMSCYSLSLTPPLSAYSESSSRRESTDSTPYELQYGPEDPTAFLDLEAMSGMGGEDFDGALGGFASCPKSSSPWTTEEQMMGMARPVPLPGHLHNNSLRADYDQRPFDPTECTIDDGISRPGFDAFSWDSNDTGNSTASSFPTETVVPSIFMQQYYQTSPLTPQEHDFPDSFEASTCSMPSGEDSSELWANEAMPSSAGTTIKSPSPSPPCSPCGLRRGSRPRKPYRQQKTARNYHPTKIDEYDGIHHLHVPPPGISCTKCTKKFQRSEHLTRHMKSGAHTDDCPFICTLSECVDKKGQRTRFNRKDNYTAHVVNCHLIRSDKERRPRIDDKETIDRLGWTQFLPQMEKEMEKRRQKLQRLPRIAANRRRAMAR